MSRPRISRLRIIAAVIATIALSVLVDTVNTHGNKISNDVGGSIDQRIATPLQTRSPRRLENSHAAPDVIEMVECMCGPPAYGVGGWIGLWFLTVLVGGVPTAVLLRLRQ
jgi:hypothetical protein